MLEDACLLSDASLITSLFDDDAVLLTGATSQSTRALRDSRDDHRPPSEWWQLRRRTAAGDAVRPTGLDHFRQVDRGRPARPGRLALCDQSARLVVP